MKNYIWYEYYLKHIKFPKEKNLTMADSTYKLIYFDIRGMAECIRYMFAYFDVEFEDSRIAREDWLAIKERTVHPINWLPSHCSWQSNLFHRRFIEQPFGKIPVLEVDEKQLSQSVAICRYLGKRFGLTTDDPFKDALLEAVVDNMRDVQISHYIFLFNFQNTPIDPTWYNFVYLFAELSAEFLKKTPEAREEAQTAFTYTYSKLEPLAADGFFYGSEVVSNVPFRSRTWYKIYSDSNALYCVS